MGESCGNLINPNKYKAVNKNNSTHNPINNSYPNIPQCLVISAVLKNFNANANSIKPSTTLTLVIQDPDLGNEFNIAGNAANNPNGNARARENPNITTIGPRDEDLADSTIAVPMIGPVQENDTIAKVNAMKKIPTIPPLSAIESVLLDQLLGNVISKYPKNDNANMINTAKKKTLAIQLTDKSFSAVGPANTLISVPIITYITIIESPYSKPFLNPDFLSLLPLIKNETVNGIIGKTQGVNKATKPPKKPKRKVQK